ncbi:hypothetical protein [Rhizobium leguminosarum]|uniref:hypothetical protein n=1 Tax=Rhizobium leguminosarum TaxID=384 RepID=UPI001C93DEB3|nr:hypothetical protein [Rhizobium leguminosarum]MBY5523580.1 hypothetical protein [Rhizobium leguminosarum]
MGDIHCSQGSDRNWTDPISNWTGFSAGDVFRDQKWFIMKGRLPSSMFAAFAHEFTHHWCFHSPVGTAIAYLRFRARTCAAAIAGHDPQSEEFAEGAQAVLDDLLRCEIALKLMRPFAEGLAQYAEYDLLPGESPLLSETAKWLLPTFLPVGMEITHEQQMLTILRGIISDQRFDGKLTRQKENLLVSTLRCDQGGYLAGYMTVKNLRYMLLFQRKCTSLLDQDLYLGFMRSFIYEDYGFVDVLLSEEGAVYDSIQCVSRYFQNRLAHLANSGTEDTVKQFEQSVLERQEQEPENRELPIILTPPDAVERGKARLNELRAVESGLISIDDIWRLAQRSMICVGRFRDKVKVTDNGFAEAIVNPAVTDKMPPEMPRWALKTGSLPGSPPGEGQGTISFFMSLGACPYRAVAIHLNDRLVAATFSPSDIPESCKADFLSFQTSYDKASGDDDLADRTVDRIISDAGLTEELLHFRLNATKVADQFYEQRALGAARKSMAEHGLFPILDEDMDLVSAFAKLGLLNSISWEKRFIADYFPAGSAGLQAVIERLKVCQTRSGVRLIEDLDNALYVYL